MLIQTEAKAQGWRAVAVFKDGGEALLYLGRSSTQVRAGYTVAFADVLDDEERDRVESIELQRWNGAPDAGRWQHQCDLKLPAPAPKLLRSAA